MKARIRPEPVPTSRIRGVGEVGEDEEEEEVEEKRSCRKRTSEGEERVSRRR